MRLQWVKRVGRCIDMSKYMGRDTWIDKCRTRVGHVYRHVHGHVHEHVYENVHGYVCTRLYGHGA